MFRTNKLVEKNICDVYIVVSQVNRFYLCGYKTSFGILLLTGKEEYFLTDSRYDEEAQDTLKASGIKVVCVSYKDSFEKLAELLASFNAKTIGIEQNHILYSDFLQFKKVFPDADFVDIGAALDDIRTIKDSYELEQIVKAQQITDRAFDKILKYIKPGITERDVCTELNYQLHLLGADGLAFDTIIASGANSSRPHSTVTNKKLANGDFVTMDFGARYNGYCSDMTRTVAIGKISEEMEKLYNIVLKAQTNALTSIKEHLSGAELFTLTNEFFSANGYDKNFLHGLGHGVGIEIHEGPVLGKTGNNKLQPNMVVTIEPGLYLPGYFGVRIEDMVIIKEGGIKNITSSDKQLINL